MGEHIEGTFKRLESPVELSNFPTDPKMAESHTEDLNNIHADDTNNMMKEKEEISQITVEDVQVEVKTKDEKSDTKSQTEFEEHLQPFMTNLKILGFYYHNEPPDVEAARMKGKSWCTKYGKRIYPYIVVGLICLNAIRVATEFGGGRQINSHFLRKLVFELWSVLCAIKVFILIRAAEHRIPIFFRDWKKLHNLLSKKDPKNITKLRHRAWTVTIMSWTFVALHTALAGYALFESKFYDHSLSPLMWDDWSFYPLTGKWTTIAKIIYLVFHLYVSAASVFPVAFYHLLCYVLTVEFRAFLKDFKSRLEANKGM